MDNISIVILMISKPFMQQGPLTYPIAAGFIASHLCETLLTQGCPISLMTFPQAVSIAFAICLLIGIFTLPLRTSPMKALAAEPQPARGSYGMKILLVTGIFPPDIGGPATYVPKIAASLTEGGHEVLVLTTSEPENLSGDPLRYPFPVVRMNRRVALWHRPWDYLKYICYYGRDVDIIYANGVFLETALANRWLHKPLVMKVVGDSAWERARNRGWVRDNFEVFQQQRYNLQVETLKAIRTWSIRQADKAIVPSKYLARQVAGWGVPHRKITVIYNAVDLPSDLQPAVVPLKTPIKVVTVGRLVSWKQVDKIIKAIAPLDDVGLVIIGDGPERSLLENLVAKQEMGDRVYFAGQRCQKKMLALMAACDIFVLNSTYEGLPHVVLEAMSLGLPVVATAVGGTPELVRDGENGRLVDPSAHQSLCEIMSTLVKSPEERQGIAAGGRQAIAQFSWQQLVSETATLLSAYHRG